MITFEEGGGLLKEVWVGWEWKTQTMVERPRFFFIDKIMAIRLEGLF
jgi:hypothetical protein